MQFKHFQNASRILVIKILSQARGLTVDIGLPIIPSETKRIGENSGVLQLLTHIAIRGSFSWGVPEILNRKGSTAENL